MALIVETGSGASDSESYISVADADTYFSKRGFALWATLTTAQKEEALRRGTDFMGQLYRERWAGLRVKSTQALDWPRYDVPRRDYGDYYESTIVPTEVKNACAELAYRASSETLAPDLGVPVASKTVGPISITYAAGARQHKVYRAVENLLAPLLKASGSLIKVVRA